MMSCLRFLLVDFAFLFLLSTWIFPTFTHEYCIRVKEGGKVIVVDQMHHPSGSKQTNDSDCVNTLNKAIKVDTETLVFEIEKFHLDKKLTIQRNLTIKSNLPRSNKVCLTCGENETMFEIERQDTTVTFENIEIRGCKTNGTEELIHVGEGTNVVFDNVKLTENENTRNNSALVLVETGVKLTIQNKSEFSHNKGRVILVGNNTKVKISNSLFSNNTSPSNGTVLATQETAINVDIEISEQSNFSFNKVKNGSGSVLWLHSTNLNITNGAQFTSNEAEYMGGAIFMEGDLNATIVDARFMNNSCLLGPGGGISIWPSTKTSTCSISRSIFVGNHAHGFMGSGGAIAFSSTVNDIHKHENGSKLSLANDVLFLRNSARANGGAVYFHRSNGYLELSSAFFGNSVLGTGGGVSILTLETADKSKPYLKVTVNEATFRENRAPHRSGGGLCSFGIVDITIKASTFLNNSGRSGGAVDLDHGAEAKIINSNLFHNNSATEHGGALRLITGGELTIQQSNFISNSAKRGAGILIYDGDEVDIRDSKFKSNEAEKSGGAIEIENDSVLRGKDTMLNVNFSNFLDNKIQMNNCGVVTGGFGGALMLSGSGVKTTILNCTFKRNHASWGGAISCDQTFSLKVNHTTFSKNEAVRGGAFYYIPLDTLLEKTQDSANFSNCTFTKNEANTGGAFFAQSNNRNFQDSPAIADTKIVITKSNFAKNRATERGGAFYTLGLRTMLENCSFRENKAMGGAEREPNRKRQADAKQSELGGAVFIEDSLFICSNCNFSNNYGSKGGAVYMKVNIGQLRMDQKAYLKCEECRVQNNTAKKAGAGFYISVPPEETFSSCHEHCSGQNTEEGNSTHYLCDKEHVSGIVSLQDTKFSKNNAQQGGNKIFSTDPYQVFIWKDAQSQNLVDFVKSFSDDSIPEGDYTSIAKLVKVHIPKLDNLNRGSTSEEFGNLNFTILDCFKEPSKYSKVEIEIKSCKKNTSCCNESAGELSKTFKVDGPIARITTNGTANFSGLDVSDRGIGNTSHILVACFTDLGDEPAQLQYKTFPIAFRECYTMEKLNNKNSQNSCEECAFGKYYSKDKEDNTCKDCPDHANCNILTITPDDGYWHATSNSADIMQCRTRKACQHNTKKLQEAAFSAHKEYSFRLYNDSDYNQCEEGYEGPLCGSCIRNHSQWNNICVECSQEGLTVLSLLAALFWNLLVLLLFLYSARSLGDRIQYNRKVKERLRCVEPLQHERLIRREVELASFAPEIVCDIPFLRLSQDDTSSESTNVHFVRRWHFRRYSGTGFLRSQRALVTEELPLANPLSEILKIILNFMQVIYLAAPIGESLPSLLKWPCALVDGFNFSETVFLLVECLLPSSINRTLLRMALQSLLPFFLLSIVGLIQLLLYSTGLSLKFGWREMLTTAFCTGYLYFSPELRTLLKFLDKQTIKFGDLKLEPHRWAVDTSIKFLQGSHAFTVALLAIPLLLLFAVSFPVTLTIILAKQKNKMQEEHVAANYGFLYKGYDSKYYYWETIIIMRKTILAFFSVFVQDAQLQAIFICMTLVVFLSIQLTVSPFTSSFPGLNHLEAISLFVSALVFSGLPMIMRSKDLKKTALTYIIATIILIVMVFALIAMAVAFYEATHEFLNDKLMEKGIYLNKAFVEHQSLRRKFCDLVAWYIKALHIQAKRLRASNSIP